MEKKENKYLNIKSCNCNIYKIEIINLKNTNDILKKVILSDKDANYGCPIEFFKKKKYKEGDYSFKDLFDLYQKTMIKYKNCCTMSNIDILNNAALDILNSKDIIPNKTNKEQWRNKIKKYHELYEIYNEDINIIYFNTDKMVRIRNKDIWEKWKCYLDYKINIKKKLIELKIDI